MGVRSSGLNLVSNPVSESWFNLGSERIPACFLQASLQMWGCTLSSLGKQLEKHWRPVAFLKVRRYDETPITIKVLTAAGLEVGEGAKVLQTKFDIAALVQDRRSSEYLLVRGEVPCVLQCLDNATTECTAAAQQALEDSVPELKRISDQFPLKFACPVTDRYSANLSAAAATPGPVLDPYTPDL